MTATATIYRHLENGDFDSEMDDVLISWPEDNPDFSEWTAKQLGREYQATASTNDEATNYEGGI